jgi:hypothetical protein
VDEEGFVTVETLARYVNSRIRSWLNDHKRPRTATEDVIEARLTGGASRMPLAIGPHPLRGHLPSSSDDREIPDPELAAWKLVEASDNCDDVRFFLDKYPNGRYLNAATLKLKQLERKGCPTPPVALSSAQSINERLRPARQFISAAGVAQAVTDDDTFSNAFVAGISGRGDSDGDGYVAASELAGYLESTLRAQGRGRTTPRYGTIRDPRLSEGDVLLGPTASKLYPESVALVITAGNYQDWARLPGVAPSGSAVAKALSEQGFKVQLVTDPAAEELRRQLWDLSRVRADKARVVLYYAGHAFSMRRYGTNMGFLVPVDAPVPDAQHRLEFFRAALDMETVEIIAQRLRALHALFVFNAPLDSTIFSGPTRVER